MHSFSSLKRFLVFSFCCLLWPMTAEGASLWQGIDFYESPAAVHSLLQKEQLQRVETIYDDNLMIERYRKSDAKSSIEGVVYYSDNKLWQFVLFVPVSKEEIPMAAFEKTCQELEKRYGLPSEKKIAFQKPYKIGDGKTLEAIQQGKGQVESVWRTFDSKKRPFRVQCLLNGQGQVLVIWQMPKILNQGEEQEEL